jgi:hypothetical protein
MPPTLRHESLIFAGDMLITVIVLSYVIVVCLVYSTRRLKLKGNELGRVWVVEVGLLLRYPGISWIELRKSVENMNQFRQYMVQVLNS